MTEENLIRKHDSGRNPFQVPDGYFQDFTSRLMQRVEQETVPTVQPVVQPESAKVLVLIRFKRLTRYATAAVVAGACIVGATYYLRSTTTSAGQTELAEFVVNEDNLDDVLDYEMLDNNQIAYYLTEAY